MPEATRPSYGLTRIYTMQRRMDTDEHELTRIDTISTRIDTNEDGVNKVPTRTFTMPTRTIKERAIIPDQHGSTRQFLTVKNYRVEPWFISRTSTDKHGACRIITVQHDANKVWHGANEVSTRIPPN